MEEHTLLRGNISRQLLGLAAPLLLGNILQQLYNTIESVARVYKSGDHEHRALDGVNLSLEEGKFIVILGPSGTEKSTLLRACLTSWRGRIFERIFRRSRREAAGILCGFQG